VSAVGSLALVALGTSYLLDADPQDASLTDVAPVVTAGAAPTRPGPTPTAEPPATTTTAPATEPTTAGTASAPTTARTTPPVAPVTPAPSAAPVARTTAALPTVGPVRPSVPASRPAPPPTLSFTLTSFNVLGASHTSSSGKRPGMASGAVRARRAAALIRRHGSDVVGFQELQGSQLATLQRVTDLGFYPGFSGDSENSIGWRRDRWTAVERHTVGIPYFDGGRRDMPFVRLRSLDTGLEAWFANFHNPAETARFHRQQRFRDRATAIERELANRLIDGTGLPVFITGDMNERGGYFCRLTSGSPMVAARGGTNNGRCLPGRPRAVDWIFGSQGVDFTHYVEDRSRLVDVTTDHPVISARVRIVGRRGSGPAPGRAG
jgi:hypothetical protein